MQCNYNLCSIISELINLPNGQRGAFAHAHTAANTYMCEDKGDHVTEEEAHRGLAAYRSVGTGAYIHAEDEAFFAMHPCASFQLVSSPSCHALWAKDSLDNFEQFLGCAESACSRTR